MASWTPGSISQKEIPFLPSRVVLQDFTGVPAVVDLATMRDAAKNLGFDTVATFIDELKGYRKQLAKPYLRDDNFNDELFDEALDRIQFDINANHILININDENNVFSSQIGIGFLNGQDYEKLERARKLTEQEYSLHPQLGYISLNQALNNDEVLAVAFQYTIGSNTYQVGEFSNLSLIHI